MSARVPLARPITSGPHGGVWLPAATLHVAFLGVGVGACLLVLQPPFWLVIGLLLAVASTLAPNLVAPWWLLLVLGLSQLWRTPSATDPTFYLLLAGIHLLHVLGSYVRLLPWNGRMQWAALVRPLRRFVLIQVVTQAMAISTLFALRGGQGSASGLSILSGAILIVVAGVFARGLRRNQSNS